MKSSNKSSYTPKYITSYTPPNQSVREQYINDISSNLIKTHGSKPSLVLGVNPSILIHQKDTDGVSMQIKGLINDLNYQLNVTGFQVSMSIKSVPAICTKSVPLIIKFCAPGMVRR